MEVGVQSPIVCVNFQFVGKTGNCPETGLEEIMASDLPEADFWGKGSRSGF
jgi:hypothetical protein